MAEEKGVVVIICCIDNKVEPGVFRWAMAEFGESNFIILPARGATLPFLRWFK